MHVFMVFAFRSLLVVWGASPTTGGSATLTRGNPRLPRGADTAFIRSWRLRGFPRWLIFYGVAAEKDVVFYRVRSGTMNLVIMKMES
jgi:hypothetical protein